MRVRADLRVGLYGTIVKSWGTPADVTVRADLNIGLYEYDTVMRVGLYDTVMTIGLCSAIMKVGFCGCGPGLCATSS